MGDLRHRGHATRRARWTGQEGASSPEYVAVALVVSTLVVAVMALGIPDVVGDAGSRAMCLLFDTGADCEAVTVAGGTTDDDGPPLPPTCTVNSEGWQDQYTTDWIFDRSVSGDRFQTMQLSDGSVVIVDTEYEGEGHVVGAGGEVPFGDLSASGSSVDITEEGRMFVLDPEALDAYQQTQRDLILDAYMTGGELTDYMEFLETGDVETLMLKQYVRDQMIEQHVTHDYYRTSTELEVSMGAAIPIPDTPIVIGAEGSLGGSGSMAVAVERATGNRSITAELAITGEVRAFVSAYVAEVGQGLGGMSSASVTVEVDEDGTVTGASLTTRIEVDQDMVDAGLSVGIPGATGSGAGVGGLQLDDEGMLEITFEVPVGDDADAGLVVSDFLRDPMGNLSQFGDVATEHGQILAQAYQTETEGTDVGVALRVLASAGFSVSDEHRTDVLTGAVSYDPFNGWLDRGTC